MMESPVVSGPLQRPQHHPRKRGGENGRPRRPALGRWNARGAKTHKELPIITCGLFFYVLSINIRLAKVHYYYCYCYYCYCYYCCCYCHLILFVTHKQLPTHQLFWRGRVCYIITQPGFFSLWAGPFRARTASSNTNFNPFWVFAEHSKYICLCQRGIFSFTNEGATHLTHQLMCRCLDGESVGQMRQVCI